MFAVFPVFEISVMDIIHYCHEQKGRTPFHELDKTNSRKPTRCSRFSTVRAQTAAA
jgi:hypothetical protein